MNAGTRWAPRLRDAAPAISGTLVSLLAQLLAGRPDADTLLNVGDALEEAAAEHLFYGDPIIAVQMRRLADVLRDEAPRRA